MHETGYDMKNYADRGGCYLPMPSSIKRSESNNCVTIRFISYITETCLPRSMLLTAVCHLPIHRQIQDIKGSLIQHIFFKQQFSSVEVLVLFVTVFSGSLVNLLRKKCEIFCHFPHVVIKHPLFWRCPTVDLIQYTGYHKLQNLVKASSLRRISQEIWANQKE